MLRRTFLQMAAAAVSAPALAAAAGPPRLRPHIVARPGPGTTILLTLRLDNEGDEPLDVLVFDTPSRGFSPRASIDARPLEHVPEPQGRRVMISRAGPRRTWRPIPPGQSWQVGEFRFTGKNLTFPCMLTFEMPVQTSKGPAQLRLENVPVQPL